MAITDNAGNVYSQVFGAARNQRAPIQSILLTSPTTVGASASLVVASFKVPTEPGKVKGVIKGMRSLQGSVAGTLGSGIVINCLNVTNSNKNCGVITQTANSIAVGAAHADGIGVLATTTTDRSATVASPVTTTTEPDVNFLAGDQLAFQCVTAAGASATAFAVQLDIQWLDNF